MYKKLFITLDDDASKGKEPEVENDKSLVSGLDGLQFFILLILAEHALFMVKLFLEKFLDGVPLAVQRGERARMSLIDNFKKMKPSEECQRQKNKESILAAKNTYKKLERSESGILAAINKLEEISGDKSNADPSDLENSGQTKSINFVPSR